MFATPVAYGLDEIPESWRPLYAAVNPLAIVIDGLRRCVLEGLPPRGNLFAIATTVATVELLVGYYAFKRFETGIADVA